MNRNLAVYKRRGDFTKPDTLWPDLQLANDFNDGLNYMIAKDVQKSLETFARMKQNGPGDYAMADNWMAHTYMRMGEPTKALAYADSALAINPYCVSALGVKHDIYRSLGDSTKMDEMEKSMCRICPWLVKN